MSEENDNSLRHYSFELLLDYAEGLISESAMYKMEDHLKECDQCRHILAGINHYRAQYSTDPLKLESMLDELEQKQLYIIQKQERPSSLKKRLRLSVSQVVMGIAASIVLWASIFYLSKWLPLSDNAVTEYLALPYPDLSVSRNGADSTSKYWDKATTYYKYKKYELAAGYLELIIEQSPAEARAHFYAGLCAMRQKEPDYIRAIASFEYTLACTEIFYDPQARWYLSLALYLVEDYAGSRELLLTILAQAGHYRYKEANQLLEKIEKQID